MDNKLTLAIKEYAYSLGADLVGISNVERYANAPVKMSPNGILPTARSVIVCSVHHPDAAIELDGEIHPQVMGPYRIQYIMNDKLDVLSFKIARMLDDMGYRTVPIASSNIWRYRGYKEMDAVFAPDISHIYGAVCAGLGELGWNGICISPEYGARNRFISIITEAELTPNPLYSGPKICDMCGECIRKCPTQAFTKEVNGVKDVVIDGKHHVFANKNLWRCAWGEHFDIDLDLPIPEHVDEKVLLDNVRDHGTRGGEFGVCLKVCLPKPLRRWDESYCKKTARRNRHAIANEDLPMHRQLYDKILVNAHRWDLDSVHFISGSSLRNAGISIKEACPDGRSAILLCCRLPSDAKAPEGDFTDSAKPMDVDNAIRIAQWNVDFTELDVCRELETVGYTALPKTNMSHEPFIKLAGLEDGNIRTALVFTSAPVEDRAFTDLNLTEKKGDIREQIRSIAMEKGADLFGVASASTIDSLAEQLREIRKNEVLVSATDNNPRMMPYDPVTKLEKRAIRGASQFLEGARSVIVLGMHYPETPAERVGKPPAESVGPYVFTQYEVNRLIGHLGYSITKTLNSMGYRAMYTHDLTGAGSVVGSPRGLFADATCNTLEAAAAGIGRMALNGSLHTGEYGIHQRFIAIVTDAELTPDEICEGMSPACENCGICVKSCPTCALCEKNITDIVLGGKKISYLPVDANRCNWATKYALCCEEGNMYGGNFTDIPYPEDGVTEEKLAAALRQQDSVFKFRPVMGERCVVTCPLLK